MDVKSFYKLGKRRSDETECRNEGSPETDEPATEAVPTAEHSTSPHSKKRCLQTKGPSRKHWKSVLEVDAVWKTFPRQQMAFDFARKCRQNVAVFAFESEKIGREGQRQYLVSTYYDFGQQYLSMESSSRHYYEVITEDAACQLYFDIEFKKDKNLHVDCISLLDTFIQYVCYQLYIQYNLYCNRSNILDLDSTTPHKFSRHLIFHLPYSAFRNNIHAGEFVHLICDQLRSFKHRVDSGESLQRVYEQEFPLSSQCNEPGGGGVLRGARKTATPCPPEATNLQSLFVLNEKDDPVLICDEAVYTRNRNFRLYLSSKLGRDVCLKLAKENKFISCYGEENRKSRHFNTLIDSLVCNVSLPAHNFRILDNDLSSRRSTRHKSGRPRQSTPSNEPQGYSLSPFPTVDHYITSQLTRGGVQGHIRQWTYFPQGKQLVYDVLGNRWCDNIQRAHKSNNIMIIVDLKRGVYYQKCHDPECKRINFRSNEYSIPDECNPVMEELMKGSNQDSGNAHQYIGELTYQQLQEMNEELDECELHTGEKRDNALDNILEAALVEYENSLEESISTRECAGSDGVLEEKDTDGVVACGEGLNLSESEMKSFCED